MQRKVKPEARRWIGELVAQTSIRRTAKAIGLADATITRVVADLPVQGGTALLVETAAGRANAA